MSNRNKTAHEVAAALAVALTSVYGWARSGCPFDEVSPPGTRGVVGRLFDIEEVQQWRAARVHGNTNVVRAPKPDPVEPTQRESIRRRALLGLDDTDEFTRNTMLALINELIDTQEAIAKQALNQIATAKRAANELVANRSKPQ